MAQDFILVGGTENDGTGDSLRVATARINTNFDELYARPSVLSDIETIDNTIKSASSNADIVLKPGGTGTVLFGPGITIDDNNIKASRSNDDIRFIPSGGGKTVIGSVGFSAGTSISSNDSSSINLNENLILDGSLTASGAVTFSTAITAATGSQFGNLDFSNGQIGNFIGGDISFGDENVSTTGTLSAATGSQFGQLDLLNGIINDSSGAISFGNENLSTTGTLGAGSSALSSLSVSGATALVGATTIDNITFNDNIISTSSNADLRLEPGGTGSVVISNLTLDENINITDNEIKATASNSDLILNASGTGNIFLGSIKISGTTISSDDSSIISINEALVLDGTATVANSVTLDSTLQVSSAITVTGNVTVTGTGSLPTPIVVDNLTLNDSDITSSSNADINITPGGTGTVDISNLQVDTNLNFTDNEITLSTSNSDFILSGSGTGSVNIKNIDLNSGTIDNTIIGGTTPAAGTFSSITLSPQATASLSSAGVTITDNTITASRSNDNLEFTANGSGKVFINGIALPNSDGGTGQVLKTDGSGSLSFFTSPILFGDTSLIDDQLEVSFSSNTEIDAVTSTGGHDLLISAVGTIDKFATSKYDSALYYAIHRDDISDEFEVAKHSVVHNNSAAFISSYALTKTGTNNHVDVTVDIDSSNLRLRGAGLSTQNSVSYYRIGLGDNDSSGYSGEDEASIVINTDLDSATENIDTFAKADFRGAKYFISVNNASKTEVSNIECVVVHDGTNAMISSYGEVNTGNNSLITLTADINGSDVRLRATGNEPNLRVHAYRIILSDGEADRSGTNVSVTGDTTISSTATTIDTFDSNTFQGAHYIVVAHNSGEAAASICEAAVVVEGTNAFITEYAKTSTKSSGQITLSVAHDGSSTVSLQAASTSGSSTKVNVYRINLTRAAGSSSAVATLDSQAVGTARSIKYLVQTTNAEDGNFELIECNVTHNGTDAFISVFARIGNNSSDLMALSADIDSGNIRLRGTISNVNTHVVNVVKRTINV